MDPMRAVAVLVLGLAAAWVGAGATRHAAAGERLVRRGQTARPGVVAGLALSLRLVARFGVGAVAGGFLLTALLLLGRQ